MLSVPSQTQNKNMMASFSPSSSQCQSKLTNSAAVKDIRQIADSARFLMSTGLVCYSGDFHTFFKFLFTRPTT